MSIERTPEPPSSLKEKKGCRGYWTPDTGWGREYECGYGTSINCEDCIYGACGGKLDPEVEAEREDTERSLTEVGTTYRKMRLKAQSLQKKE